MVRAIPRIRLAANLANRFASDLIGIAACILPPYPAEGAYFVTREMVERERQDIEASLARAEAAFRTAAGAGRPRLEWRSGIELPEFYVASEARAADLLIIGRSAAPADVTRSLDPGGTVFARGPPGIGGAAQRRHAGGGTDHRRMERHPRGTPRAA